MKPGPNTIDTLWDELMRSPHIPQSTYRLQFGAEITFSHAIYLVDYLDRLGVSDLYASPLFTPRPGSVHGYDTVDYNALNPVLGSEQTFNDLSDALKQHGMNILLDIVPNHMGVSTENVWWTDVLKQGPSSHYASYFDINWKPQNRGLDNKILLPILHSHYGHVLEEGYVKVVYWHGDFYVHYFDNQFPMTPESYIHILESVLSSLPAPSNEDESWVHQELASLIYSLKFLPPYWLTDPDSIETRQREQAVIRRRLLGLFDSSTTFRTTMEQTLTAISGTIGVSSSFDTLDIILSQQPYKLAYWRVASDEINYRRFFDINDMVAIRTEKAHVFNDVHQLTFRLLAEGKVQGLRIDHPDGLWDPARYLLRLQTGYIDALVHHRYGDTPQYADNMARQLKAKLTSTERPTTWPLYVLVEKILSESEPLPSTWSIYGTTGYDFMFAVNNLFVASSNEAAIDRLYTEFSGEHRTFEALTDHTKALVMSLSLTSEIASISADLARIVEQSRRYRGFTQNSLALGLREFISALDIYRTYITSPNQVSDRDHTYIVSAMARAKKNNPMVPGSIFDFLCDILLMRNFDEFDANECTELHQFVMKFQQITGPVMAKSVEDTAFYIYNRLVSLNEVGGHPDHFGTSIPSFHAMNRKRQERYPYAMLATSTHDTKRSEDVRARINVLSEIPDKWEQKINEWATINALHRTPTNGIDAPTRNDEYLIYQTLLGTYDPTRDDDAHYLQRITGYMEKAINEAKTNSNWVNPNQNYKEAINAFITSIWKDEAFRASFDPFHRTISFFGRLNGLSQLVLKLTCPGVPDLYQGTELWDYSLVDPDNRRPIDFEERAGILDMIQSRERETGLPVLATELMGQAESGAIKLYTIYRILRYRQRFPSVLREGTYIPLEISGPKAEHVCAFLRSSNKTTALIVTPRFYCTLTEGAEELPLGPNYWANTFLSLPSTVEGTRWNNLLTDETIALSTTHIPLDTLFNTLPFAVLAIE